MRLCRGKTEVLATFDSLAERDGDPGKELWSAKQLVDEATQTLNDLLADWGNVNENADQAPDRGQRAFEAPVGGWTTRPTDGP